jgi:hypothetical protein
MHSLSVYLYDSNPGIFRVRQAGYVPIKSTVGRKSLSQNKTDDCDVYLLLRPILPDHRRKSWSVLLLFPGPRTLPHGLGSPLYFLKYQKQWRIRDVYPGSRISDPKIVTKERGEKKICYHTFYVVTNFTKLNIMLFLKC